ncbi:MAG: hypothetical protein RL120_17815, partial [Gammaproteobacteria bacterium]
MQLSQSQIEEFDASGKLTLDFGFDPQMLDRVVAEVELLYQHDYRQPQYRSSRVQDAWRDSHSVRALATHPGV